MVCQEFQRGVKVRMGRRYDEPSSTSAAAESRLLEILWVREDSMRLTLRLVELA